jgi:hypothetical protein
MHVTTVLGKGQPFTQSALIFDKICDPAFTYESMFIRNLKLYNFRKTYTIGNSIDSSCSNNRIATNHRSASD